MNRQINAELFLAILSLILAVGLINMADLLGFFKELAKGVGVSSVRSGVLFLFLAAYVVFFFANVVAFIAVWRSFLTTDGTIPVEQGIQMLSVPLVSVLIAYALVFTLSASEAMPRLSGGMFP